MARRDKVGGSCHRWAQPRALRSGSRRALKTQARASASVGPDAPRSCLADKLPGVLALPTGDPPLRAAGSWDLSQS